MEPDVVDDEGVIWWRSSGESTGKGWRCDGGEVIPAVAGQLDVGQHGQNAGGPDGDGEEGGLDGWDFAGMSIVHGAGEAHGHRQSARENWKHKKRPGKKLKKSCDGRVLFFYIFF